MSITAWPAPTRLVVSAMTKKPCAAGLSASPRPAQSPIQGQQHLGDGLAVAYTVFAQWDATATLLNGDPSYFNHGLNVITLRWGRIYAVDVFEDSQEAARRLEPSPYDSHTHNKTRRAGDAAPGSRSCCEDSRVPR
jgi:hypothetical protein